MANLRTLLTLGRVSNLPTVWSNCLAGWLLGGGGSSGRFWWLCLGATCLYVGGMFLNDAFDAAFDRQHRRERPIPSGKIGLETVWAWGFGWLLAGTVILLLLGKTTGVLAVLLVIGIVVYDAIHKLIAFSPVLMAACRLLLYLVAASAAADGITGWSLWSAFALAAYIVGLSYLARQEKARGPLYSWPCYLLVVPIGLALIVNSGDYQRRAFVLSALLVLWMARSLRSAFWTPSRNVGRTVSGLLAGIVLVDLLAILPEPYPLGLVFLLLFGAALLFQRFIPAT